MNASELKRLIEDAGTSPHFFDRKTMKFFGDTMRNYGVQNSWIVAQDGEIVEVYKLYRRRPVRHGLFESAYFDKKTLKRRFSKRSDHE
jgi:hypothetical protein